MSTSIINNIFETFNVRTVVIEGDPWFIAKDVAEALGYKNTAEAIADHCKRKQRVTRKSLNLNNNSISLPDAGYVCIPESDVYRLIIRSRLKSAERFEDWVTEVVLPNLRKHGGYSVGQESLTPEMQDAISLQHKATHLATACLSGVIKSGHIKKADQVTIHKVLTTVAHTCIVMDTLGTFDRDAAGALARAGLGHYVKAIPLDMAKALDDKWIHAKKDSLQWAKHNAEGNGWF